MVYIEGMDKNQMQALLILFKDVDADYNARSLSSKLGITPMGSLKILKKLEKQDLLASRRMGKAVFYKPNLENDYTRACIRFLLQKEAHDAPPRIKRWVNELRKLDGIADIGILFGSIIHKEKHRDVDVLLILKPAKTKKTNRCVAHLNRVGIKRIHAVKQTKEDFLKNLRKKERIILSAVRDSVVLFGYDEFVELIRNR